MAPHKAPELRRPHGAEGLQRPGPPRARHPGFTADAQSTLEPVEELEETVVGPGGTEQTHCPEKRREERERRAGRTLLPSSDASCRVCTLGGPGCERRAGPGVNAGRARVCTPRQPGCERRTPGWEAGRPERSASRLPPPGGAGRDVASGCPSLPPRAHTGTVFPAPGCPHTPQEAQRWPRLRGCSRWPSEGRD